MGMVLTLRESQPGDLQRLNNLGDMYDLFTRDDPANLCLEKSWHALDRLLTTAGDDPALGFLMAGGTPAGADASYGPPRLLSAAEVSRLDAALAAIADDQFWAGFDAAAFEAEGVYPGIWDEDPAELRDEYVSYLTELRGFVRRVAGSGGQILILLA